MNDQKRIGALVDFGNPDIGVFIKCDDEVNVNYGELLLLATTIFRMFSLALNRKEKGVMMNSIGLGSLGIDLALPGVLDAYASFYKQGEAKIILGADSKTKRGFFIYIAYDKGSHVTRVKPRGFGLLGKNIESGGFMSVMAIHQFLSDKYTKNTKMKDAIDSVTRRSIEILEENNGKLNPFKEFEMSEMLAKDYYPFK